MKSFVHLLTKQENIISYALGFVIIWFGINEILSPQEWIAFAPPFLGDGKLALGLVMVHGIILSSCALLLFFNMYHRIAGAILSLMLIEIIIQLILQTGLSDISVRDIGLLGMAVSLVFSNPATPSVEM